MAHYVVERQGQLSVKFVSDRFQQIAGRNRLGKDIHSFIGNRALLEYIRRIAAHEDNTYVRADYPGDIVGLPAVLVRHDYIKQQQLYLPCVIHEFFGQRILAIVGFDDSVAVLAEQVFFQGSYQIVIFCQARINSVPVG